ncbi:MAG: hypothetical protein B7Y39_12660 [Bdellovibrio sp. 28-41-41]|nr:MAG: hypothetical protein B7Y39_12660 [Bdellovibrio sp. 28-41-41]
MNGLIIEGVAGTGKSTIISALKDNNAFKRIKPSYEIIYEDQTTGELVAELRDKRLSDQDRYSKLNQLIPEIRRQHALGQFLILERFHPTFFALMAECVAFEDFDQQLSELNFGLVLLDLPNNELEARSFSRPEMESQNWSKGLIDWYGSREAALLAFAESQEKRRKFLMQTKLKNIRIDTSGRSWDTYIKSIVEFVAE